MYKKLAGGIVLTGGGSQLQGVSQLFEYMTGLDTRIGYPNEHLGRTVLEEVKSPMYATTVGLVLAGFKALDDREDVYRQRQDAGISKIKEGKAIRVALPGKDIFASIRDRLKDFIMDDIEEDNNY
jgi:cell division protein FtsA